MSNPVPAGYKMTEVGIIPDDWEVTHANEICTKIQDGTHFSPKLGGSDYLYITSQNIGYGHLDLSKSQMIDEEQHKAIYRRCDVKKGDLLLTKDGVNTGNAAINWLDEEFSLLSSVAFLRFEPANFDARFFMQYILSNNGQFQIKRLMSGNAITRLTLEKINGLHFPLPPTLAEQRAIADALSDVDAQITALDDLIAKKRAIKQGTMQRLLTGEQRLPGFSGEWEVKRLGEVANIKRGASPRPIADSKWFGGSVGWVRIMDVTGSGIYLTETTDYLSDLGVQQSVPIYPGELIMSIAATVGLFAIAQMNACIHDGFVAFKNLHQDVNTLFLYYYLTFNSNRFTEAGQTGSQKNVNAEIVSRIEIAIPEINEQKAIAGVLSDIDAEIRALEEKREKVATLKGGMMQELLTGRTRLI